MTSLEILHMAAGIYPPAYFISVFSHSDDDVSETYLMRRQQLVRPVNSR
jgi:hypothetical protein